MFRSLISSPKNQTCFFLKRNLLLSFNRLLYSASTQSSPLQLPTFAPYGSSLASPNSNRTEYLQLHPVQRPFSTKPITKNPPKINTKVNFSLSDSDSDSEPSDDNDDENNPSPKKQLAKTKLPPPYNPFNKTPVVEEPQDPKDLQRIFHDMRAEGGLVNNAVKMFDALSKDGLTHEALELFRQIKDKGHMPDVVAHTAVVEAYATAGHSKEALKVFLRMLASGVAPNAYTYSVLIKGLAADGKLLGEAKKYVMEMIGKGMRPNAGTYTAVFEAFVREEKVEEGREFLVKMKENGFVPDEKSVREVLGNKRGPVVRSVINILFK
ncbi:hypothetical protein Tsubulata_038921 [Turnera subulata]|uniref:Pentacotripeptide-repeat region of PRORP domain-containing protein n=1 Tax=Turnera subulata TaxID=218843 RepID=A0A9Q0GJT5_9ROSI|nr:hypothetical protein Tsubulata_038921 [Turnera subulata]